MAKRYIITGLVIALGVIAARLVGKFFGLGVSTPSTTTTA